MPRTPRGAAVRTGERTGTDPARAGMLAMLPLAAAYAPFGFAIGVVAGRSPDPVAAWAGSVLVFAGSAHLAVVDAVGSGAGIWAGVGAAVLINARLLVLATGIAPLWRDARLTSRLLAAAVIIDPTWMLTTRRLAAGRSPADRVAPQALRRYYAGAALTLLAVWPSAVAIGEVVARRLGTTPGGGASGTGTWLEVSLATCLAGVVGPHLRKRGGAAAVAAATGLLAAMAASALAGSWPRPPRAAPDPGAATVAVATVEELTS